MHVDVSGDPGPSGLTDVHSEVYAVGRVELAQDGLHALREFHHLMRRRSGELLQFIQMLEGHYHHMAGVVWESVHHDKAVLAAMQDAGFGIVAGFEHVAKNAGGHFRSGADVGVTPGGP